MVVPPVRQDVALGDVWQSMGWNGSSVKFIGSAASVNAYAFTVVPRGDGALPALQTMYARAQNASSVTVTLYKKYSGNTYGLMFAASTLSCRNLLLSAGDYCAVLNGAGGTDPNSTFFTLNGQYVTPAAALDMWKPTTAFFQVDQGTSAARFNVAQRGDGALPCVVMSGGYNLIYKLNGAAYEVYARVAADGSQSPGIVLVPGSYQIQIPLGTSSTMRYWLPVWGYWAKP